jgi:hypothetical protein
MSKKRLTALAGLALAGAMMATPVLADTNTNGSWGGGEDGKTNVTYTVASNYTVIIPSSLAITAADTYVGTANNVFIESHTKIAPTEKITVSLPAQTFEAKDETAASTIPFTMKYTTQTGTTAGTATEVTTLGSPIALLTQTGAQIAVVAEDGASPVTGQSAISATIEAKATTDQIADADLSGVHTGTVTFEVAKS